MKKKASGKFTASPGDYRGALQSNKDFFLRFTTMSRELESAVIGIINRYLEEYDILYLKNPVMSVLKELMNNAVKANAKRIHFSRKNLNINSEADYREGMRTFKNEAYGPGSGELFRELEASGLTVRISFGNSSGTISISVINNIPILPSELRKIRDRVAKAYEYRDISDAFEDVIDDTEGAGLGLIMAIMVFKNSGLSAGSFTVTGGEMETAVTISLPKKRGPAKTKRQIAEQIAKGIAGIPSFPEKIAGIRKLCAAPNIRVKKIIETISRDPGLAASVLKYANSPAYTADSKIHSVDEAVRLLGARGINALLTDPGVASIAGSKQRKYESLWKKSNRRAFYAKKLSLRLKNGDITDSAYLGGLLADIGTMALLSLDPDLIARLKKMALFKGIDDANMVEEISLGLSHSSLGAMICEKWKFDDLLVKGIEFHHRPSMAPDDYIQIVYIVYLADLFIEIEEKKNRFDTVDKAVLDFFKITDEKKFRALHDVLKKTYMP